MNVLVKLIGYGGCLFVAMPLLAGMYQWTDPDGTVHFSDQATNPAAKPIDVNALPYNSTPATNPAPKTPPPTTNPAPTATPQEIQAAQEQQTQVDKTCQQYRDNLSLLQETGRRVYQVDKSGEYHYFTDAERQQQITDLNTNIQKYCTTPPPAAKP